MKNPYLETKSKEIFDKIEAISGFSLAEMYIVSTDPDCIADIGVDHAGCFVLENRVFPLKVIDLTNIRYRCYEDPDSDDNFIRFDFGDNISLDWYFCDYRVDCDYHVRYHDENHWLKYDQVVEFLKQRLKTNVD